MKRTLLALIASLAATVAMGADYGYLNGCVVDGENGAPITQALITVREPGYISFTNYTDDNGCTWGNTGYHLPQPKIQVDVEGGPYHMPFYGYAYPTCTAYPVSPPYVLCEFVIELVPRLSISGQVTVNFRSASETAGR